MDFFDMLRHMGPAAMVSILVSSLPMFAGAAYVFRPSEQRLALMRPLSLAAIFAGLNGATLGFINTLKGFWMEPARDTRIIAIGAAESMVTLYVAFSCLMIAWICVAIGMRRGNQ